MKDLNKKIMSLILSGALVSSVGAMEASATYSDSYNPDTYVEDQMLYNCNRNGLYVTMVGREPIYVYLNNSLRNEYLNKNEALNIARLNYGNVYAYEKTVIDTEFNPVYTPYSQSTKKVYALSGESYVNSWTRIDFNSIPYYEKVATTIELGEFLLKNVDLSNYKFNRNGFVTVDLNRDGNFDENLYLGNDKVNKVMDKSAALRWAYYVYGNYYVYKKTINNSNYGITSNKPFITIYAVDNIIGKTGWTLINPNEVPEDEIIATNTEMYDAMINLDINFEFVNGKSTDYKPTDDVTYVYANKKEALEYGYANYSDFCLLTKVVNNQILYTLSTEIIISKDGWEIIANDDIPEYAIVFLSLQDALNYEYLLNNNYSLSLK